MQMYIFFLSFVYAFCAVCFAFSARFSRYLYINKSYYYLRYYILYVALLQHNKLIQQKTRFYLLFLSRCSPCCFYAVFMHNVNIFAVYSQFLLIPQKSLGDFSRSFNFQGFTIYCVHSLLLSA